MPKAWSPRRPAYDYKNSTSFYEIGAGQLGRFVHGFGFSYALQQELQFAGSHLVVSLFSFNVGIEIGQLAVLAVMLPALYLLRRILAERIGVILLSAIVAHTAWHWMMERWEVLRQVPWPRLDPAGLVVLARWVAALLLAVGGAKPLAKWIEHKWPPRVEVAKDTGR
jgi:HupE / UreJ protein